VNNAKYKESPTFYYYIIQNINEPVKLESRSSVCLKQSMTDSLQKNRLKFHNYVVQIKIKFVLLLKLSTKIELNVQKVCLPSY